jgi:hypothetical protein
MSGPARPPPQSNSQTAATHEYRQEDRAQAELDAAHTTASPWSDRAQNHSCPAAGIWLVVLSALLFAIGDWWAASLLVVAAVLFWAMFYVLRIVQG